jgi:hypothetical protein
VVGRGRPGLREHAIRAAGFLAPALRVDFHLRDWGLATRADFDAAVRQGIKLSPPRSWMRGRFARRPTATT